MENTIVKKANDGAGIVGIVTITNYIPTCERAIELDRILAECKDIPRERYMTLLNEFRALCETKEIVLKNQVVLTGRAVLTRILGGDFTYTGEINYGALGTASTAINDSQTQLATEVKRKLYASRTRSNDQLNIDFYYSKADTNGTYQEFGTFIDGTSSANTGQMWNRVLTGGWTKSSSEAMTVAIQFNINHA